jgi:hypothetical protein
MPKFKNYTAKLVERQIRAIINRNPDNINPKDDKNEFCLYHKGRGQNIQRCLIGQWGYEQGFKTPDPLHGDAEAVIHDFWSKQANFEDYAVVLMVRYQMKADGRRGDQIPWKDIVLTEP